MRVYYTKRGKTSEVCLTNVERVRVMDIGESGATWHFVENHDGTIRVTLTKRRERE